MNKCSYCNAPEGKPHGTHCSLRSRNGQAYTNGNGLIAYGIQNEQSDIRAHVGVLSGKVYVYRTEDGLKAIETFDRKPRPASQPGVNFVTAYGFAVPWRDIPRIVAIPCKSLIDMHNIRESDSTSDKGDKAAQVVETLIRYGWFPLPVEPQSVTSASIQRQGVDLIVQGKWRIQVKCDFRAGDGHEKCTGNLYLQIAERNPFKAT